MFTESQIVATLKRVECCRKVKDPAAMPEQSMWQAKQSAKQSAK
ncbi:hypothetical protein VC218_15640 [Xanthomonas nasturtii]|nr:hypothetical protein [Xanthomonas nasturtii]